MCEQVFTRRPVLHSAGYLLFCLNALLVSVCSNDSLICFGMGLVCRGTFSYLEFYDFMFYFFLFLYFFFLPTTFTHTHAQC